MADVVVAVVCCISQDRQPKCCNATARRHRAAIAQLAVWDDRGKQLWVLLWGLLQLSKDSLGLSGLFDSCRQLRTALNPGVT